MSKVIKEFVLAFAWMVDYLSKTCNFFTVWIWTVFPSTDWSSFPLDWRPRRDFSPSGNSFVNPERFFYKVELCLNWRKIFWTSLEFSDSEEIFLLHLDSIFWSWRDFAVMEHSLWIGRNFSDCGEYFLIIFLNSVEFCWNQRFVWFWKYFSTYYYIFCNPQQRFFGNGEHSLNLTRFFWFWGKFRKCLNLESVFWIPRDFFVLESSLWIRGDFSVSHLAFHYSDFPE